MEISYFPKLFQILELDGERRKFKVAVLTESFCRLLLPYGAPAISQTVQESYTSDGTEN